MPIVRRHKWKRIRCPELESSDDYASFSSEPLVCSERKYFRVENIIYCATAVDPGPPWKRSTRLELYGEMC